MILKKALNWTTKNPKRIFIIDGIGALLSAILLGIVLVRLEIYFGIPKATLFILALFPCLFAVYDLYSYCIVKNKINLYLKGIAGINTAYCFISIALTMQHSEKITLLGWMYLLIEITIVCTLAYIEWNTAKRIT